MVLHDRVYGLGNTGESDGEGNGNWAYTGLLRYNCPKYGPRFYV